MQEFTKKILRKNYSRTHKKFLATLLEFPNFLIASLNPHHLIPTPNDLSKRNVNHKPIMGKTEQ